MQLCIRIQEEDRKHLEKVCLARGESITVFVRRAMRRELAAFGCYPKEVKQFLNVKEGEALEVPPA